MKRFKKFMQSFRLKALLITYNSLRSRLLNNKFFSKLIKYINLNISPFFPRFPRKVVIFSFVPAGFLFLYLNFLAAPKYISEMSIALNNDRSSSSMLAGAQGLFPAGVGADSNVAKLKLFLESKEATSSASSILSLKDIYSKGDIFNRLFFSDDIDAIHNIRLSNLQIELKDESSALIIKSKAYDPNDAFNLNMSLIVSINHYLNKNTRLANEIIETNKICELQSLRSDLSNNFALESNNAKELILSNELLNGSDLIIELTQKRRSNCLEAPTGPQLDNNLPDLTSDMLFSAYETALKSITSNRLEKWNNKDSLEIVAEPNLPIKQANSYSFLKSIGLLIVTILIIYTSTILQRIFKEFEL